MAQRKLKRYVSTSTNRINLGPFGTFVPSGPPTFIGDDEARPNFAAVTELGESKTIRVVVGLNKGLKPRNRTGKCAFAPKRYTQEAVDETFLRVRGGQVGLVGATRTEGKGWYESKPEPSVTYELAYVKSKDEPDYETFRRHVDRLAERLAQYHCQDTVLILRDDGTKKTVALAKWQPKKRK